MDEAMERHRARAKARAFRPASCEGERCWCGALAEHKVEETVFADDPEPIRHPFTAYVCRPHFVEMMGPVVQRLYGLTPPNR